MAFMQGVHYIYKIHPGDTLYSIAQRFGSTVNLIEQTNAIYPQITDPGLIYPGQVLAIPEAGMGQRDAVYYLINPGDSLYSIGLRFSASPELLVGMNPLLTNPNLIYPETPLSVPAGIYEVESGDSLFAISRKLGIRMQDIVQANQGRPGFSPDVIYPNYHLIVPLPTSRNIAVYRPLPGSVVQPGQVMEGQARAFEATILYQIKDDRGVTVANERHVTASAAGPEYGFFSAPLYFDRQPTTSSGELWVYARSAKDGTIIDLVQVKIYF